MFVPDPVVSKSIKTVDGANTDNFSKGINRLDDFQKDIDQN